METKKMKLSNMRIKLIIVVLFLFLLPTAYADIFFDATGGLAVDWTPDAKIKKTKLKIRAFYISQIQFGNNVLLNGGFSIATESIFSDPFLQEIPSSFSLDELSLIYRFTNEASIALFAGEYESAGTDTFVRRHFGVQEINSNLLKGQIGKKPASIFAIDGYGLALSARFSNPLAIAFYTYYNEKSTSIKTEDETEDERDYINIDFRVAGVTESFIGDFVFGVGLSLDKNDNDDGIIIEYADFHIGLTMLLGRNSSGNVYMQFGIARIQVIPADKQQILAMEDLYLFIEPRFATKKLKFALSLFALPKATTKHVQYIDNSAGASLSIESMRIDMGNNHGTVGGFITVSLPNPIGKDVDPKDFFDIKNIAIQVVPYTEITIGQSALKVSVHVHPLKYEFFDEMIGFSVTYKIQL